MPLSNNYVLSVSYGNYLDSVGGTDKVILAHQRMFNIQNIDYLYLFPFNLSNSKPVKDNNYWGLIDNGTYKCVLSTHNVMSIIADMSKKGKKCVGIHIHHLRNVNMFALRQILDIMNAHVFIFIHDFYNICTSTNLICSENGKLCRDAKLVEKSCCKCRYYSSSLRHQRTFIKIVDSAFDRITFVFPSDSAREYFFKQYSQYNKRSIVIYHQKLIGEYERPNQVHKKIKIAYVGSQLKHKGWNTYLKLVGEFVDCGIYEFYYFGAKASNNSNIHDVSVNFSTNLNAMVEALRKMEIDCVILWSIWPETYAYTYYECLASDCYIITHEDSGNICSQVMKRNNGIVFKTEDSLFEFFREDEVLLKKICTYRKSDHYNPMDLVENDAIIQNTIAEAKKIEFNVTEFADKKQKSLVEIILNYAYKLKVRK